MRPPVVATNIHSSLPAKVVFLPYKICSFNMLHLLALAVTVVSAFPQQPGGRPGGFGPAQFGGNHGDINSAQFGGPPAQSSGNHGGFAPGQSSGNHGDFDPTQFGGNHGDFAPAQPSGDLTFPPAGPWPWKPAGPGDSTSPHEHSHVPPCLSPSHAHTLTIYQQADRPVPP